MLFDCSGKHLDDCIGYSARNPLRGGPTEILLPHHGILTSTVCGERQAIHKYFVPRPDATPGSLNGYYSITALCGGGKSGTLKQFCNAGCSDALGKIGVVDAARIVNQPISFYTGKVFLDGSMEGVRFCTPSPVNLLYGESGPVIGSIINSINSGQADGYHGN